MHAIYSSAQRPCIYMQMEPGTSPFTDDEPEEADDDEKTPEIMLVPRDPSTCERITLHACQLRSIQSLTGLHSQHAAVPQWKTCSRSSASVRRSIQTLARKVGQLPSILSACMPCCLQAYFCQIVASLCMYSGCCKRRATRCSPGCS